jgi:hypothetical protein
MQLMRFESSPRGVGSRTPTRRGPGRDASSTAPRDRIGGLHRAAPPRPALPQTQLMADPYVLVEAVGRRETKTLLC